MQYFRRNKSNFYINLITLRFWWTKFHYLHRAAKLIWGSFCYIFLYLWTLLLVQAWYPHRPTFCPLFKTLKPLIALRSAYTVLPVCLVKQLKCLCKICAKFAANFHTHTRCSSSSFIVTLSLIRRTACARAQFGGCSSATNGHSETRQMAVCCQNLPLSALSSRRAVRMPVGALFKKFGLFLNTPCI